ncbi:ROK family protein [Vulgatibacter sp.]|uniref:ROK family protein n=1 Tax=Vulgatibacter sp. TaxID=1971226 RepID=UPI00356877D3
MSAAAIALGCDLGGTNVRVAVVEADGHVRSSVKRKLTDRSPEAVAKELAEGARDVLANVGASLEQVGGIGVGVAGQCLGSTGMVLVGPNLGWRNVPFGALVERELGRRARIVNDLSAAAWGEAAVGGARGARDVILVFVGSGVGSGLILNGALYEGAGGIAGEFGHVKVVAGGRPCGCGELGCLEAYVGGHNITRRIKELEAGGKAQAILKAAGGDATRIGGSALELAAEEGDTEAQQLRSEIAQMLGVQVGNLVTVLNPSRLILGGGVLTGMPGMKSEAIEWIRRSAQPAHMAQATILDAALGDDAGVIGAGLLGLLVAS